MKVISYQRNWVNQQKSFNSGHFGANQLLKPLGFYIYRCSSPESGERDVDLPHDFFGVCTVSPGMSCLKFQIPVKPCLSRIVAPQKIAVDAQKNWMEGKRNDGFNEFLSFTKHFPQDLVQPLLCPHLATLGFEFPCFGLEIPKSLGSAD